LYERDTWYLVDTISDPGGYTAKTVVVSSPRRESYKLFERYQLQVTLHMPTWTFDELTLLQQKVYPTTSTSEMAQRLGKIGGVPRFIFSTKDLDREIQFALSRSSLEKFSEYSGVLEGSDDVSNVLVHIVPNSDYKTYTLKIASQEIKILLAEVFEKKEKEKLCSFLAVTPRLSLTGRLQGDLFEGWTHRILRNGGTFEIRNLKNGKIEKPLVIPLCQDQQVENFSDKGTKIYYRPLSENFPCIDSWIPNIGFFQMTVSMQHPIKEDGLGSILSQTTMRKFYFVIPNDDERFNNFKWQSFKTNSASQSSTGKRARSDDNGMYADQLEQYVLKIKL